MREERTNAALYTGEVGARIIRDLNPATPWHVHPKYSHLYFVKRMPHELCNN